MKALVLFHSVCGNCFLMAREFEKALRHNGMDVKMRRVEDDDLERWQNTFACSREYAPFLSDIQNASVDDMVEADLIFTGSPTYFGNMSGEMKKFLDSTSVYYSEQKLGGKLFGAFTSSSSSEGGGTMCLQSLVVYAQHMGMIPVPVPISAQNEAKSASAYGIVHHSGYNSDDRPNEALCSAISKYVDNVADLLRRSYRG